MTLQGLLFLILLGIFLQLVVYAGVGFFRHWLAYQALREQAGLAEAEPVPPPPAAVAEQTTAWPGWREFRVAKRAYEDTAGLICSFHLEAVDGKPLPAYRPGQFLTFRLGLDGRDAVRCYSLSDRPDPARYRVSIKRVPGGQASNHFHDRVREGAILAVKAPGGHFHIDPDSDAPAVLVAGGIGITPVYSMLAAALAARPGREIRLFYGVRDGAEMAFRDALDELAAKHANFHLHLCFSRPGPDDVQGRDYRHEGRVDIRRLRLELPLKPYHFYICGPAPMMESLVPALEDWGVPAARLHYEAFGPATVSRRAVVADSVPGLGVTFSQSGIRADWQGGSLLELAEASGVKVESGCRSGGCGACQTAIVSGEVAYAQRPDFEVEPGHCLLCLGQPRTELVLAA